ncbi:MAG: hypothetical protein H0T53_03430 [Herpetosiphonaceae bacterium]|nr:hypothetical protein [Herpetosiphonaceae bacterium]
MPVLMGRGCVETLCRHQQLVTPAQVTDLVHAGAELLGGSKPKPLHNLPNAPCCDTGREGPPGSGRVDPHQQRLPFPVTPHERQPIGAAHQTEVAIKQLDGIWVERDAAHFRPFPLRTVSVPARRSRSRSWTSLASWARTPV